MKRNMTIIDRLVRTAASAVLIILLLTGVLGETAAVAAGIAALLLFITGMAGFCPVVWIIRELSADKEGKNE